MSRSRSPRGEGDQLREKLMDATEDLLAAHGDERQVTVRAIVGKAGVTPPSLYLHFATKEELVAAVVARRFTALGAAIAEATAEAAERGDAAGALREGCLTYLSWARENPGGYAVLFGAERHTELGQAEGSAGAVTFGGLVEGVEACQQSGQAREGDPHGTAAVVWAGLHGIATLTSRRRGFEWPSVEWMVDELLGGVVGTPPREG